MAGAGAEPTAGNASSLVEVGLLQRTITPTPALALALALTLALTLTLTRSPTGLGRATYYCCAPRCRCICYAAT